MKICRDHKLTLFLMLDTQIQCDRCFSAWFHRFIVQPFIRSVVQSLSRSLDHSFRTIASANTEINPTAVFHAFTIFAFAIAFGFSSSPLKKRNIIRSFRENHSATTPITRHFIDFRFCHSHFFVLNT